jgi:hypothetical protein
MTPSGIDPATFRFVVQFLNHCATAYFMYITSKTSTANLKLTDNLMVSPDTSTLIYGNLC